MELSPQSWAEADEGLRSIAGATLVTAKNTSEFERVSRLTVVDWAAQRRRERFAGTCWVAIHSDCSYKEMIEIVWDEPKRQANLVKHGLDFASVPFEFFLTARIATARAGRYQALGLLAGRPVVVIFKPLGSEAFSLISLRPASAAERTEL